VGARRSRTLPLSSRKAGRAAISGGIIESRQRAVIAFLEKGALGGPAQRIDTHGAHVFLAGGRAFKMKRAVRFSFLDFSTLEKREATLRAELLLNRRTAPMLYRRVLPVTRDEAGRLALDGTGEPVEWLLEMRRFPAEAELDRVAGRGELGLDLAERLGQTIASFHAAAEVRPEGGGHAAMREIIDGNTGDLARLAPWLLGQSEVEALDRATRAELARHRALLDRRRAGGRVRRCHGDLHLGNIVLLDGRPVLFDCIEFSEAFATVDVLYDLAFLLMDLVHRELGPQAQRLLQAYNDMAPDDEGLALLPLFVSVRAVIRAKVLGFNAEALEDEAARAKKIAEAGAYLAIARRALEPVAPRLVAVGGRSGTGKSTLARALAPGIGAMPGAVVLRSDVIRKGLFDVASTERLPECAYNAEASMRVFETIARRAAALLAAGRAVVADGVYGDVGQRASIEAAARDAGVRFDGFWLIAPEAVLLERVEARRGDASDADRRIVLAQRRMDEGSVTWRQLRADRPLAELLAETMSLLES
jgi:aminoglycoside phosphotransferase family enzyme/predicted kinase